MVNVTIDGIQVEVEEGTTILAAAEAAGRKIPTLCALQGVNHIGACRICVVRIEGEERMAAACNTAVYEGMVVHTNTPEVVRARRSNLQMIMAEHNSDCNVCLRNGSCALQDLCRDFSIGRLPFEPEFRIEQWDANFPLQRDASKCIKCMRCVAVCEQIQHCSVWDFVGTGPHMKVSVHDGKPINTAGCALCGQCINKCPTGALTERDDTGKVMRALLDPDTMTVVQVAPAVRAAWGEGVDLAREDATVGRMVSALRELGFDRVFDTDFAADLTIMEEASEFIEYVQAGKKRPMFTSCCPGWVRFAKLHYPQFVPQLSTSKSPHQMMGATVKNTLAEAMEQEGKKKIFCLSIMPCVAKKYECDVPQLATEGGPDVDAVLTVREFDRLLRMFSVDAAALPETAFDDPLGLSTGAATIFGRTGGVMEAALRTAVHMLTGENIDYSAVDCTAATPEKPWISKAFDVAGLHLEIAIASGLENTATLLDALESGEASYDFVEIMACPGGCVNGGGQPIAFNCELAGERAAVLNSLDAGDTLRRSHDNPDIAKLYETWLDKPLSEKAEAWLHTEQGEWAI